MTTPHVLFRYELPEICQTGCPRAAQCMSDPSSERFVDIVQRASELSTVGVARYLVSFSCKGPTVTTSKFFRRQMNRCNLAQSAIRKTVSPE